MPTPSANKDLAQGSPEKILDPVAAQAFESLDVYGNCSRSTLWAIQMQMRQEESATLRASSVLVGGIFGTGEMCGSVLGGLIATGGAFESEDFRDTDSYESANEKATGFLEWIHETFGSTRCFNIQQPLMEWYHMTSPSKDDESLEAGGPLACAGRCAQVSRHVAAMILGVQSSKGADCESVDAGSGQDQ